MHPPQVRAAALELIAAGHNDCEVSRMLGIPRTTIRDWRRPTYVRHSQTEVCPRCWRRARAAHFIPTDYAELLALYLGDGCISRNGRTFSLRITLDSKYQRIIEESRALLARCFLGNSVYLVQRTGCVDATVNSSHLPCLFPQYGEGKKHERPIALESWQLDHVRDAPWALIRGCIRSDGSCFINRTDVHRPRPYEYLSYHFANMSKDIVDLFVAACNQVGVFTRVNCDRRGRWQVRINRRESVALMLEHVGRKE
jgi:hypothetical protein